MIIRPPSKRHLSRRKRSKLSEKKLAARFNGRVQPASGALPVAGLKGDVITTSFLFDDKTTLAKSFSVKREDMVKLARQAFGVRKLGVMRVCFESTGDEFFVLPTSTFKQLIHSYEV